MPLHPTSYFLFYPFFLFSNGVSSYNSLLVQASYLPFLIPFVVLSMGQVYLMKRCFVQNVSALGQLFNEKISFPSHAPIPLKPYAINANYSFT